MATPGRPGAGAWPPTSCARTARARRPFGRQERPGGRRTARPPARPERDLHPPGRRRVPGRGGGTPRPHRGPWRRWPPTPRRPRGCRRGWTRRRPAGQDHAGGRPHPGDRAARACGQPHQQLQILPVAQHVSPAAFGPEALHGRLEVAARLGQSRQTAGDHRLHLRRSRRRIGLQCLDDEQRVALAVLVEALEPGRVKRRSRDAFGQQRCLLTAEPAQLDLAEAPESLQGREAGERVVLVELLAAGGGRDEQPRRRRNAHQVVDQAKRLRVGPLHVVGDHQQRRPRDQRRAGDRAVQPVSQLRLGQRLGRRHLRRELG